MLKIWPLPRTVVCVRACVRACVRVCVCVCVCVCSGWGQDVITIQTSTMTPLSATVSRVSTADGAVVTNAFYSHNACWYMRALNNNGNEHTVRR